MSVLRFSNGAIVDTGPWADGKPALLFKDGSWVIAEGNPSVPWTDLKDAIVLSPEEIASLPPRSFQSKQK